MDWRCSRPQWRSLTTRGLRIYAEAGGGHLFHYRERSGDLVVEQTDDSWAGFEVRLGGALIEQAAASLIHLAQTRLARTPSVLAVITGTEFSYLLPDGAWVIARSISIVRIDARCEICHSFAR